MVKHELFDEKLRLLHNLSLFCVFESRFLCRKYVLLILLVFPVRIVIYLFIIVSVKFCDGPDPVVKVPFFLK